MLNLLLYKSPQDVEVVLKISRDVMLIVFEIKGHLLNRVAPLQVVGIAFHCCSQGQRPTCSLTPLGEALDFRAV